MPGLVEAEISSLVQFPPFLIFFDHSDLNVQNVNLFKSAKKCTMGNGRIYRIMLQ